MAIMINSHQYGGNFFVCSMILLSKLNCRFTVRNHKVIKSILANRENRYCYSSNWSKRRVYYPYSYVY